MQPALAIVTGTSRGLGHALAQQLLDQGWRVLAIARHAAGDLSADPADALTQWTLDLAQAESAAQRLAGWLATQPPSRVALIHNAATLSQPAPLADSALPELAAAVRVGLEAPLLMTAAFLKATAEWHTDRRVLNVSSGLGRRAMAGSASYCAVKAGLDHLTRALALEEAARPHGARVVSLAPGVIDTDMQTQLRRADRTRFPEGARFEAMHAQGQLDSPATAAAKVLRYLLRDDFGVEPVADVRQA
jgi:NAD(P)-dependent dehydrogenase (short-subunit alcohol dehydrogenase family)